MNVKCIIRTSKLRCSGAQWGQECEQWLWKFKQLPTKFCRQLLIFRQSVAICDGNGWMEGGRDGDGVMRNRARRRNLHFIVASRSFRGRFISSFVDFYLRGKSWGFRKRETDPDGPLRLRIAPGDIMMHETMLGPNLARRNFTQSESMSIAGFQFRAPGKAPELGNVAL